MSYADGPGRAAQHGRQSLAEFATLSGLHPDLIRRLVALGLVEAYRDPARRSSGSPAAS